MTITPIGWLCLPLGVLLFFLPFRWLLIATVLSLPFLDALVIGGGNTIQVFQWFGMFLVGRYVATMAVRGTGIVRSTVLFGMFGFLGVAVVSLIMPLLLRGRVHVLPLSESYASTAFVPLQLRGANVVQLAYPIFGIA